MAYSCKHYIAFYTCIAVPTFRPGSQGMHHTPMTARQKHVKCNTAQW